MNSILGLKKQFSLIKVLFDALETNSNFETPNKTQTKSGWGGSGISYLVIV
jgi:hypothetical protein